MRNFMITQTARFIEDDPYNSFSKSEAEEVLNYLADAFPDACDLPYIGDCIAFRCDWSLYDPEELVREFGEEDMTEPEDVLRYLDSNTIVIRLSNGNYAVQAF